MGPHLVLVSPCFWKNVIVPSKIVSFLCSLDKGVMFVLLFFYFILFYFIFLSTGERHKKSFSTFLTFIHTCMFLFLFLFCFVLFCFVFFFAQLLTFLPSQFCKNCELIIYSFSLVRLLVLILIRDILKHSISNKMVSKI